MLVAQANEVIRCSNDLASARQDLTVAFLPAEGHGPKSKRYALKVFTLPHGLMDSTSKVPDP